MKEDKGPFSILAKLVKREKDPQGNKPSMYIYVMVVLVLGVGLMIASNFVSKDKASLTTSSSSIQTTDETSKEDVAAFGSKTSNNNKIFSEYEKEYEDLLKKALEDMAGVSDVTVMVNVDASEKKIYEKNRVTHKQVTDEVDREGGKRQVEDSSVDEQLVITRDGEKEVPLITQTEKPAIRGVLVVAKGAENIQVKKMIKEAVTRVLDVPSHRVAVMAKN